MMAAHLVATTEGLCTAFGHANVIQLALGFELCECADGDFYGNVGVDASALI